jgi:hypothetical protein
MFYLHTEEDSFVNFNTYNGFEESDGVEKLTVKEIQKTLKRLGKEYRKFLKNDPFIPIVLNHKP